MWRGFLFASGTANSDVIMDPSIQGSQEGRRLNIVIPQF